MNNVRKNHLLLSIPAIVFLLASASCARVELNTTAQAADSSIARIYVGLTSQSGVETFEKEIVQSILNRHVEGATIEQARGVYQGKTEESVIVTIINCCRWSIPENKFRSKIHKLAEDIKNTLNQESLLVEYINSNGGAAFEVYE